MSLSISRSQACCRAFAALLLLHAYVLLWCSVLGSRGDEVRIDARQCDTAAATRDTQLQAARDELGRALGRLVAAEQIGVIEFHSFFAAPARWLQQTLWRFVGVEPLPGAMARALDLRVFNRESRSYRRPSWSEDDESQWQAAARTALAPIFRPLVGELCAITRATADEWRGLTLVPGAPVCYAGYE